MDNVKIYCIYLQNYICIVGENMHENVVEEQIPNNYWFNKYGYYFGMS